MAGDPHLKRRAGGPPSLPGLTREEWYRVAEYLVLSGGDEDRRAAAFVLRQIRGGEGGAPRCETSEERLGRLRSVLREHAPAGCWFASWGKVGPCPR